MASSLLSPQPMDQTTATALALLTLVAAFYLMDLTNGQGVTWRAANHAPASERSK